MKSVDMLRSRAGAVFEIASDPAAKCDKTALVVYRTGGMHVVSTTEWSLTAIIHEFGANEVYMIDREAGKLTVEAWSPTATCKVRERDREPAQEPLKTEAWKRDFWLTQLEATSAR